MTYYDLIARGYDELHGEEQIRKARILAERLQPQEGEYLLDIGCGTGVATGVFECRKFGVDPSRELLRQAGFPTKVGVAEDLPYEDYSFDIIISLTALHHCADPKRAIDEMLRVGKRQCRFGVSMLKKAGSFKRWDSLLRASFEVKECVDEGRDMIYILVRKAGADLQS